MRKSILFLFVLGLMLTVACRQQDEPLPTIVPTAPPVDTPDVDDPVEPTATAVSAQPETAPDPVSADEITWAPQLLYSSPAVGEEVMLDGAITIRFDQPMDQTSVEEALVVQTADGDEPVAGTVTWARPDTMLFTPNETLERRRLYRLNIGDTALSTNGIPIERPIELELETVGALEVAQIVPTGGDVEADSQILIFFNRPVVPLVTTGQQDDLPQPFAIEPAVEGNGRWISTSIYQFSPTEPLASGADYTITVADGLTDVTGALLEETAISTFTTTPPRVVSVIPFNGSDRIPLDSEIVVTFDTPMNQAATESAISLSDGATEQALSFVWSEDGRIVTVTTNGRLDFDTNYTIQISEAARSQQGDTPLARSEQSDFTTVALPRVLEVTPRNNSTPERYESGVSIRFSAPVLIETLEDILIIEPEPNTKPNYNFSFGGETTNDLYVSFPFVPSTDYRITIPGTAQDPYGNFLNGGEDYTWTFRTRDYDPVASLNLPNLVSQVSTAFPSDLQLVHVNVDTVDVAIFDIGLPIEFFANSYRFYEYNPTIDPIKTITLNIDDPLNQVGVSNIALADGGTLPTGIYALQVRSPEINQDYVYWQNQRNMLIVADTNVIMKELPNEVRVWATDIESGTPQSNLSIALYNDRGAQIGTAVTDNNGLAIFTDPDVEYGSRSLSVVAGQPKQAGFGVASLAWNTSVSPWEFGYDVGYRATEPTFVYMYTDRPIYRPGDTVEFKGIVRQPNYGRFNLANEINTVPVEISSLYGYYEQGEPELLQLDVQADGTFATSYLIPEDAQTGVFQLRIADNRGLIEGFRSFTVAEYRAPEFFVEAIPEKTELLRGDTVDVTVRAEYFAGGSPAGLEMYWSASATPLHHFYEGPYYYSFGDTADFVYNDTFGPFGFMPEEVYLIDGTAVLDANGEAVINLPADLLARVDEGGWQVVLSANVTDVSGRFFSVNTNLTYHAAETYVGITPVDYIATANSETAFDLLTVDWDGNPVPNQDVSVVFYRREWQASRTNTFGNYYTSWEPVDTEVGQTTATTNADGEAQVIFVPEVGGSYIAVATVTDAGGRQAFSSANQWVSDRFYAGWRIDPRDSKLTLVADQESYAVGDTAEILVQSPYAETVNAWLTIERGNVLEEQFITLNGSTILEIPITADHSPNAYVTITAVKPVDRDSEDPYADMRLGIVELVVPPDPFALNVSLEPRETAVSPGETAIYDIKVTDNLGNPVQADISLALVDLAILTIKEDNAEPILEAFYRKQPYYSNMGSGAFISAEGLEAEIPFEQFGGGGGGADEATDASFARLDVAEESANDDEAGGEEDATVRQDFRDTAFWRASLQTDANGEATIEIPLPDNLTTWRLSSKAVTANTLVGQSEVDIVASLPLLLRPITPRFLTVGDEIALGTAVQNNTANDIEAIVSLEADGVTTDDPLSQEVTIPANGQLVVRWLAKVQDVSFADLTFRVEGGGLADASKPTFGEGPDKLIPIVRYNGRDVVATSGILDSAGLRVEAVLLPENADTDLGELHVELNATLAGALIEALESHNDEPYSFECPGTIAYRLLPNVATTRAIAELQLGEPALQSVIGDQVTIAIDRLQSLALPNGGWGWCHQNEPDEFVTAYVVLALTRAQQAGFTVDNGVISNGVGFLFNGLTPPENMSQRYAIHRQIFNLYVMAEAGEFAPARVNGHITEHWDLLSPVDKALLLMTIDLYGAEDPNRQRLLDDLESSVILSATGAHWEDENSTFRSLFTDVQTSAIVIEALLRTNPDSQLLPQAVRWLMIARNGRLWPYYGDTAWSIQSLTSWMIETGELEAEYAFTYGLYGGAENAGAFSNSNLLIQQGGEIPLSQLTPDEVEYVTLERGAGNGRLYYNIYLNAFLPADQIDPVNRGLFIERTYYDASCDEDCQPLTSIRMGQQVRVELNIVAEEDIVYAVIEDPLPSGAEAIDPNLNSNQDGRFAPEQTYERGYWGWWYFNRIEFRDELVRFTANYLPKGSYQYTYYMQATIPGTYQVMPTFGFGEYYPEVNGRSPGLIFTITEE